MRALGKFLAGLLIFLLALVVLIVGAVFVADGMIRDEVEQRAARALQSGLGLGEPPEVTVEGYPVAWNVLTTSFPAVRVQGDAMNVRLERGGTVLLTDLDLTFRDVKLTGNAVRAATAEGGARLGYADLGAMAGVQAKSAGGDQVTFTSEANVFGARVPIGVTGRLTVDPAAQTVAVTQSEINVAGVAVPRQVSQPVVDAMLKPVAVPLPYGLRLEAMTPDADGVAARVGGTDVSFPMTR